MSPQMMSSFWTRAWTSISGMARLAIRMRNTRYNIFLSRLTISLLNEFPPLELKKILRMHWSKLMILSLIRQV